MQHRKQSIVRDKRWNEDQDVEEPDHSDVADERDPEMALDDESECFIGVGVKRPRRKAVKGFNRSFPQITLSSNHIR
jgi:hypothetical protein